MVCRRLHERQIYIFNGDCSPRQRGTTNKTSYNFVTFQNCYKLEYDIIIWYMKMFVQSVLTHASI